MESQLSVLNNTGNIDFPLETEVESPKNRDNLIDLKAKFENPSET